MAALDHCLSDTWQTKCSTISERTRFIFNNELLSDVKFVVTVSSSENGKKAKMAIPGHKFVLAISSPVFYAMFYGQMAETRDSVELPDCEYDSLLELFRYLYCDEVNLTGSNVMHVLYLAKKYMVHSLADKCTEYLRDHVEASNVFTILTHAQKFGDKDLEDRCWGVVEVHTKEAVTSDEFVTLERSLVESLVSRDMLNVEEVELFKAVDHWATNESERKGLNPDGKVKRRLLGEDIVKAIRFPLMSKEEFVSVVDCDILTKKEISDMMKHYCNVSLNSPLPFIQFPRTRPFHRCHRFAQLIPPGDGSWMYSNNYSDAIELTVSKSVKLHGVQHFGSEGGEYRVSTEVKDVTSGISLVKQSGSYSSEKDKVHAYYSFDVKFNHPVYLEVGKIYVIVSTINGPVSWYGCEGGTSVEAQEVKFTFSDSGDSSNETSTYDGQFPAFLFSSNCCSS